MYQVFEASDIFGQRPPQSSNDDFTLQQRQRYRDPDEGGGGGGIGGGIDDVLGWLGLPSPGGGTRAGYDDPGGGGGGGGGLSWLPSGLRALDETGGLGQLMMMETDNNNDDAEYFDYSCLSSGLMSPDVESEFFGAPFVGGRPPLSHLRMSAADPSYSWSFNPSYSSTLPDRPPSPLFADFRFNAGSDVSFPVVTSCGDLPFDSEAEERVREIARYLASFEVQPWSVATPRSLDSSCSTPGSDPTSPFQELGSSSSMSGSSALSANHSNGTNINSGHKLNGGNINNNVPVGFFHAGFDDSSCGLETTMVNPNDVFPDRTTDHQYACSSSRPPATRDHPTPRTQRQSHPHPPRSSQRTSPHHSVTPPKARASSVLEALLRSTEPIDPNKGSGAAVAMDDDVDGEQRGMQGRRSPERMPVKKGRVGREDDLVGRRGGGQRNRAAEETLRAAAAAAAKRMIGSETEVEFRASGGTSGGTSGRTFAGFVDVKQERIGADESELARELRQIIGDETVRKSATTSYSFASEFRSAECFRCN